MISDPRWFSIKRKACGCGGRKLDILYVLLFTVMAAGLIVLSTDLLKVNKFGEDTRLLLEQKIGVQLPYGG